MIEESENVLGRDRIFVGGLYMVVGMGERWNGCCWRRVKIGDIGGVMC